MSDPIFPAPPLDQIPLGPGQFLMVDGFDIPALLNVVSSAPHRALVALSYVDGFGGFPELQAQAPPGLLVASISVNFNPANFGDDERFALDDNAYRRWRAIAGIPIAGEKGLYKSVSGIDSMIDLPDWKWAAHYGAGAHVCSPRTCNLCQTFCGATQCYNQGPNGENVDISVAQPGFLGIFPTIPITNFKELPLHTTQLRPDGRLHIIAEYPLDPKDETKGADFYEIYQDDPHNPTHWAGQGPGVHARAFPVARVQR